MKQQLNEKKTVYYILTTTGIGGAEKRFIELCLYLVKHETRFNFKLILPEQLFAALKEVHQIDKCLREFEQHFIVYNIELNGSLIRYQKDIYRFVSKHATANDIVHFILAYPSFIFPLTHRHTIYSLTTSSLKNVNIKGRVPYLLNVLRAKYVDILDPGIYKKACRYFFFKKKRLFQTPGSFVDTNVYTPENYQQKDNTFVFLGRFFYLKQAVELLMALPEVCRNLDLSGIKNYRFIFLGYGQLEKEMSLILNRPAFQNLPIEIKMTNRPEAILAKSKVFFSLQLRNNYPSKSLIEAMACGNIPLVTDVGTTRLIARPEYSYYVPEKFKANDISDQLINIMQQDESMLQCKMDAARKFVIQNCSIEKSADYYAGIYNQFL